MKWFQNMMKALHMELREHRSSFFVYIMLRALVIACMVLQALNGNYENVFLCLLTLVLLAGLMPAAAFAADPVENTAPAVEDLATVDELRTEFDMDDSTNKTFKQVYFGNKAWQWSIAGVDPAGGAISGLKQTVLRSKTDAMRSERT